MPTYKFFVYNICISIDFNSRNFDTSKRVHSYFSLNTLILNRMQ